MQVNLNLNQPRTNNYKPIFKAKLDAKAGEQFLKYVDNNVVKEIEDIIAPIGGKKAVAFLEEFPPMGKFKGASLLSYIDPDSNVIINNKLVDAASIAREKTTKDLIKTLLGMAKK